MLLRAEHYDKYLKDQNKVNITQHFLRLKKDMLRLKRQIEYDQMRIPQPLTEDEERKIRRYRWYIQDTLSALELMGEAHLFEEDELNTVHFQKNLPDIQRVVFCVWGFFGGKEEFEVLIEGDIAEIFYTLEDTDSPPPMIYLEPDKLSKKEFLKFLQPLHMGEWRVDYSTDQFGYMGLDGTRWELEIYYSNDLKKREYGGLNAFPYNFHTFQQFFESKKREIGQI